MNQDLAKEERLVGTLKFSGMVGDEI